MNNLPPCPSQWSHLPLLVRLNIALLVFRCRYRLSLGQAFLLRLALLALLIYQFLPSHPMSVPTAIGLAASIASIVFVERSHELV